MTSCFSRMSGLWKSFPPYLNSPPWKYTTTGYLWGTPPRCCSPERESRREQGNASHSQLVQKCSKTGSPHLLVCSRETKSEDQSADTIPDYAWRHSPRTTWKRVAVPGVSRSIDCYTLSTPSRSHPALIPDQSLMQVPNSP